MSFRIQRQEQVNRTLPLQETMPTKKAPFCKDTISDVSKEQNQKESSFKVKVKQFFSNVWKWIAEHIFCCFYKKMSKAESDSSKQEPVKAKKEAQLENASLTAKDVKEQILPFAESKKISEAEKRFEALSLEEKNEWRLGLQKLKESGLMIYKKSDRVIYKLYQQILNIPYKEATNKRILEVISQSKLSDAEKEKLTQSLNNQSGSFYIKIHSNMEMFDYLDTHLEIISFCDLLIRCHPSRLEIEAVFSNFSQVSKDEFLNAVRKVNGNPAFSEDELLRVIQKDPYGELITQARDQIADFHQKQTTEITGKKLVN